MYRACALAYALILVVQHHQHLVRPWLAWSVLAIMAVWTVATAYGYSRPEQRTWRLVVADLAVAFSCLFATALAADPFYLTQAPPLSSYWFAGAVLAAGAVWGARGGALVAILYGLADITLREAMGAAITSATVRGVVLLLLVGMAVGYMSSVAEQAEKRFAQAVSLEARLREREQLARSIHDSVLQVLALVRRRGEEAGGPAAELGRMAGEQEVRLRSLVTDGLPENDSGAGAASPPARVEGGVSTDLRELVRRDESTRVSVSAPATPVLLDPHTAREVAAAIHTALDNIARHCPSGTGAWVLVEDEGDLVIVTVRDDGPGIPEGRLEHARREGRLGIAQSVMGRVRDLGGTVEIITAPEEGTEIEMRVPRERL